MAPVATAQSLPCRKHLFLSPLLFSLSLRFLHNIILIPYSGPSFSLSPSLQALFPPCRLQEAHNEKHLAGEVSFPLEQEQAARRGRLRAKLAPHDAGACSAPAPCCCLLLFLSIQNVFSPGTLLFETHSGFMPGILGWLLSHSMSEHFRAACVEGVLGCRTCCGHHSKSFLWLEGC